MLLQIAGSAPSVGRVRHGSADPIVLARAAYWRGRAAEAAGQSEEMHAQYEAAAHYPTAYYGQLGYRF